MAAISDSPDTPALPPADELAAIEAEAAALARLAGAEIASALLRGFHVEYKTQGKGNAAPTDPVSEVDRAVEAMIRERLGTTFPGHGIIGEEVDTPADGSSPYLWVVDPVDGTTNFVNGFPLFAASIGVLYDGVPIAGATWCSASHRMLPGVYHARRGGGLSFDGEPVDGGERNTGIRRQLAAAPGGSPGRMASWDHRVTGSAAIECAFVAAGIFTSARFAGIRIWDVASGVALIEAAGGETWVRRSGWERLGRFTPPSRTKDGHAPTLRDWSQPLILGRPEAVEKLRPAASPGILGRARQLVFPGLGRRP
jgi:myo-inositol-1(or 4)-monophosphatase